MNPYQGTARSNATAHPFANSRQLNRALRRAHKPKTAPAPTKNRAGILVPAAMPKSAEARSHQGSGGWGIGNRLSIFPSPFPSPHSPLPFALLIPKDPQRIDAEKSETCRAHIHI